jgi:hypothetical protein
MQETTNETQPLNSDDAESPARPMELDPLSPIPCSESSPAEHPLALDPLGPIRRFG